MQHRRTIFLFCSVAILLLAAAYRLPALSARPFHGDEAVNAVKFRELWEKGEYRYEPHEFHGPTLPYATLALVPPAADGYAQTTEADYRIVTALFGIALVALTLCAAPGIGYGAALVAALLTAVSTAMVFYSRYYIHEVPLVVFTFAAILCGWRYSLGPSIGWAVACGVSLALMHATKETAVLAWIAMAAGVLATGRLRVRDANLRRHAKPLAAALTAFLTLYIVLFSSFFTNWPGILDGVRTYFLYLDRGTGGEPLHVHPWYWYLKLLLFHQTMPRAPWFSEAIFFVFVTWCAAEAARRSAPLIRFLLVYTLVLGALYSAIPYKTPWCVLSLLHGLALLTGIGFIALLRSIPIVPVKFALVTLMYVAAAHLSHQSYRANFVLHTHWSNPWVYAHPVGSVREVSQRVEELAALAGPESTTLVLGVFTRNLWPLPFYLRGVPNVGYPETHEAFERLRRQTDAAILLVPAGPGEELDLPFAEHYAGPHHFALRPDVQVAMYVRKDVWERFMDSRRGASPTP